MDFTRPQDFEQIKYNTKAMSYRDGKRSQFWRW